LTFLARALAGFSGADIAEFCRRACAAATKESIENKHKMERSNSHNDLNTADPMAEIRQEHFEKAIKFPRCCPSSDHDIHKCEMFAQMRQRYYGYDLSFLTFKYPQNINDGGKKLRTISFLSNIVI
jgi:transitional endoplasmic reticulum ATPase